MKLVLLLVVFSGVWGLYTVLKGAVEHANMVGRIRAQERRREMERERAMRLWATMERGRLRDLEEERARIVN